MQNGMPGSGALVSTKRSCIDYLLQTKYVTCWDISEHQTISDMIRDMM